MSRSLNSLIIVVFKFKILPVTDGLLKNFRATLPVLDVPLPFLTKDTLIFNCILNKCWNFFFVFNKFLAVFCWNFSSLFHCWKFASSIENPLHAAYPQMKTANSKFLYSCLHFYLYSKWFPN